jgi:hypothetical protein
LSSVFAVLLLASGFNGCGNETARAPNPTAYDWPDTFAYRMRYVARAERDTEALARHEVSAELTWSVRSDGAYLVRNDSLRSAGTWRDAPPYAGPLWPRDTVPYLVQISRWGEFLSIERDCDPAVPACREAALLTLAKELRHVVPLLPVWWPPRGFAWEDTVAFGDFPRPRGVRGVVRTVYRSARDTVVKGAACWIVTWHSEWPAVDRFVAGRPLDESGTVFVDKKLLIPAYAEWRGTYAPPLELGARGATRIEARGSAVLAGSVFDSLRVAEESK